jgi:DNA-binding transcriptional LysR family regulator
MTRAQPDDRPQPLRVAFVPGVTPDKWARRWAERMPRSPLTLSRVEEEQQTAVLYDGRADMCLVRLPVDRDGLHVIRLYTEVPVVVAPRGHFVEAADEVSVVDLADEHLLPSVPVRQAIDSVAAGAGIVIVPLSVARLHHRRDVVHRPVTDVPETAVALAWRRDLEDERVETFIGVVRGRSINSSRG